MTRGILHRIREQIFRMRVRRLRRSLIERHLEFEIARLRAIAEEG